MNFSALRLGKTGPNRPLIEVVPVWDELLSVGIVCCILAPAYKFYEG